MEIGLLQPTDIVKQYILRKYQLYALITTGSEILFPEPVVMSVSYFKSVPF